MNLKSRINAIDMANGGEGNIVVEVKKEVALNSATMYIVRMGVFTASFIIYEDGTLFHQDDWQSGHPEASEEIADFDWLDENFRPAVILDGLPRIIE